MRIRPSKLSLTCACPGSVRMQHENPTPFGESEYAKKGTATHWVAEQMLLGHSVLAGVVAPNGVVITAEMLATAEYYSNFVVSKSEGEKVRVEEKVHCSRAAAEGVHGTCDAWVYIPSKRLLRVMDLKSGYRRTVAKGNHQLIAYATGIMDDVLKVPDSDVDVELIIVQPNVPVSGAAVDVWAVRGSDLRPYANDIANSVGVALGENPPFRPGMHCGLCDARGRCDALRDAAMSASEYAYSARTDGGVEEIGRELIFAEQAKAVLDAHVDGLTAIMSASLRAGEKSTTHYIKNGNSRLEWREGYESIFRMGDLAGVELRRPPEPITPTQAIKKGVDKDVVALYASRRPTSKIERIDLTKVKELLKK